MSEYDPLLVVVSILIAVFGAYTALDMVERARASAGRRAMTWLGCGAFAMGAAIWSMHFVGMLAFQMAMPVSYDLGLTFASFVLPIFVSGLGLYCVMRLAGSLRAYALGGGVMGIGIVSMHYLGMAAMRMEGRILYDPSLVALSVAIAVTASTAGLWLAFRASGFTEKALGAVVLGMAVISMHYCGMAAATFVPMELGISALPDGALHSDRLAMAVALLISALLALLLAGSAAERRATAKRVMAEQARYRAVVDNAADPIVVVDQDGRIESLNKAAQTAFGYDAAEALSQPIDMLLRKPLFRTICQEGGGKESGRETEGRCKDGRGFPLLLSVASWEAAGRRHFTWIMRDISEQKAAADALRHALGQAEYEQLRAEAERERAEGERDRAEKASASKSRFLAAASHDLRQPVQSLFFFSHSLNQMIKEGPAAQVLASMEASLDALRMLLDSLLDVSRLDAGIVKANPIGFALGGLLERLATEYRPLAAERGLTFRVVPSSLWIESDPVLLERMLRNLIDNALRYTEHGAILIGVRRQRDRVRIDVVDTGPGIPQDKQAEIFDEFVQLHNSERDRRQGLGLGLAIVKRLSALLHHHVIVASTPGHGSRFSVSVPLAVPREMPRRRKPAPGTMAFGNLVVVIEDDALILLSLRAMLEAWGYRVVAASSSEEATQLLRPLHEHPDAIVSDLRLRDGKTGIEAIRDIYGLCGLHIPAILLTGETSPEYLNEARQSGFDILHKPVSSEELQRLLAMAVS
ncbi:MHYT domain-containing protein [Telmatospirillum sp. J64-1]|uniref:hybrid sensor histidine kinase/response regulator n=1 Tax=Telmatospirillum sp. J64-1 TaxID=2502183 RepID=UPI00115ED171|nr:MHYT domain-containing protein [Telmatospirillum sp. J64-1]